MPITADEIARLLDQHWGPLLAWVGHLDGFEEDVTQHAFIKLATADPAPQRPVAWLYTVTRRLAINQRLANDRRKRRDRMVFAANHRPNWSESEAAEIVEILARLEDIDRQIVVARVWSDLSFEEIADIIGQSKTTVWRRYRDAIQQLQRFMGVTCPKKH